MVPAVTTTVTPRATAATKKKAAKRMTCAKARRVKGRKARAKAVARSCPKPKKKKGHPARRALS